MAVINSNPQALMARQHQHHAQGELSTAMERLSSGLRVNSAKDDAAGQSIGNRMTAQIDGQHQAARNANDGISMSQTAQGALNEINERLQRIRELTVQGLNATNSGDAGDRIQAEINLNLKEINRLNQGASFNGIPLLDGRAGTKTLQVGANDGETLSVDLNPPGFSVEELGLRDLTIQGTPGTITPVNQLSGYASRIPLDDVDYTTAEYVPPDNNPNLVNLGNRDVVQLNGDGGRLKEVSVSASHDTDTRQNDVTLSVRDAVVGTTAREWISTRQYQDAAGNPLSLNNASIVQADGKYWIQHTHEGSLSYYEAELTFQANENKITAQAKSATRVTRDDIPGYMSSVSYAPGVNKNSADYSLTLDGSDASSEANLELVYLGGDYYVEEQTSPGQYAYYHADVAITTGGDQDAIAVTSERNSMPTVTDQPYVTGSSQVHLKPSNANVQVNYVDTLGTTHQNVMRGGDEQYKFNIDEFVNGGGANKTASIVRNQRGEYLLQTVNGTGEVILYYPMTRSVNTNVENNLTTVTLHEASEAQRIRNPARPLSAIDEAIARVDAKRGELGALDNRLDSAIDNLTDTSTNLTAARSRIMDADYAEEVANMTKAQILQQASTSMLAQANQVPQTVLSLLN